MFLKNVSVLGAAMLLSVSAAHANPGQNTTPGNPQGAPAQQADQPHERGHRGGLETRGQTRQPAPDGTAAGRPNQPGTMGDRAPRTQGQDNQPDDMDQGTTGQGGMTTQPQPGQDRTRSPGHPRSSGGAGMHD